MYGFACVFFLCCYFSCAVHIFLSLFQSNSSLSVRCYQQEPADTIMYIGHAFAFVCTVRWARVCMCVYMNRWWVRVGEIKRMLSIGPINNGIFYLLLFRTLWAGMHLCLWPRVYVSMCISVCMCRSLLSIEAYTTKQMNVVPCKLGSCTMHAFNADMIYYISVIQIYER